MKKLAQDDLTDIVSAIVESLLTQQPPHVQLPSVTIKPATVNYTYELRLGHGVEVLSEFLHLPANPLQPLLSELHVDAIKSAVPELGNLITAGAAGITVTVPHNAFVITWANPVEKGPWLKSLADDFDDLVHQLSSDGVESLLHGAASGISSHLQSSFALLNYNSFLQTYIQNAVLTDILSHLNLTSSDVQALECPPVETLDITNTPFARNLSAWMKKHNFAIGNEAQIKFDSLTFDLTTYRLEASLSLRHRHVWNLGEIPQEFQGFLSKYRLQ